MPHFRLQSSKHNLLFMEMLEALHHVIKSHIQDLKVNPSLLECQVLIKYEANFDVIRFLRMRKSDQFSRAKLLVFPETSLCYILISISHAVLLCVYTCLHL